MTRADDRETMRFALWAVLDALTIAACVAGRASELFNGTPTALAFENLRGAIVRLRDSPEVTAVRIDAHQPPFGRGGA